MSEAPSQQFTWTVGAGDGLSAIPVPFDPRAVFGKVQAPVVVALCSHVYRTTISTIGGTPWVPLRRSNRDAAGVAAGDTVEITLTLDPAPREVPVPADLAAALAGAGMREAWDALSYTARREQVEGVESAKQAETRTRRIAKAVAAAARR